MFSSIYISKFGNSLCKVVNVPLSNKQIWINKENFKHYSNKLDNSISRARSTIYELALCNNFYWFVTITINSCYDRKNLNWFRSTTNQIIRNLRKKFNGELNLFYLLIPEKHKDGSYHMHGLFSYDFIYDFYINKNRYLSWNSYDQIGFSSISKIDNYVACCKYITKYISKEFKNVEKDKHTYFCSQGLKRKELDSIYIITNKNELLYDKLYKYANVIDLSPEDCKLLKLNYLDRYCYSKLK